MEYIENHRHLDVYDREHILEHFLPISKQTPKPSTSIECKDVECFLKIKILCVMKWARLTRDHKFL